MYFRHFSLFQYTFLTLQAQNTRQFSTQPPLYSHSDVKLSHLHFPSYTPDFQPDWGWNDLPNQLSRTSLFWTMPHKWYHLLKNHGQKTHYLDQSLKFHSLAAHNLP